MCTARLGATPSPKANGGRRHQRPPNPSEGKHHGNPAAGGKARTATQKSAPERKSGPQGHCPESARRAPEEEAAVPKRQNHTEGGPKHGGRLKAQAAATQRGSQPNHCLASSS